MAVRERLFHILEAQQFPRELLEEELFPLARDMETIVALPHRSYRRPLQDQIVCVLFAEASTRTRLSFETAIIKLGGTALTTENAAEFSSLVKGESIEDTVRVIAGYGHSAIVMRHKEDGASARAAKVSKIPIINAGDGQSQHPTQACLDVYTIQKELGHVDGARVAIVGDLKFGSTVNSLAYFLGKFNGVSIDFISPPEFGVGEGIKEYLEKHNVSFTEGRALKEAVKDADVVYMTRPQLERHKKDEDEGMEDGQYSSEFQFLPEFLDILPKHSIIMHPLPRNQEIPVEIDQDPRAVYFRQSDNGLPIRMALLNMIIGR